MLLLSGGGGLRGDFVTAFRKAIDEQPDMLFAQIDPDSNPRAATLFEGGGPPAAGRLVLRRDGAAALEALGQRHAAGH